METTGAIRRRLLQLWLLSGWQLLLHPSGVR